MNFPRRKRLAAILLLPLIVVLSGCFRFHGEYVVTSKDKIDVKLDVGVDKKAMSTAGQEMTGEDICSKDEISKDLPEKTKKEPYDDGKYVGCRYTASGGLTADELKGSNKDNPLTLKDGVWTFKTEKSSSADAESMVVMKTADFEFKVTFPGEVLTHNGKSKVSGNTVIWTDYEDMAKGLEATGKDKKSAASSILPLILGGLGLLALIGIGVAVVLGAKRKKQQAAAQAAAAQGYQQWGPNTGMPPAPGAYPPGPNDQWGAVPQGYPGANIPPAPTQVLNPGMFPQPGTPGPNAAPPGAPTSMSTMTPPPAEGYPQAPASALPPPQPPVPPYHPQQPPQQ